MKGSGYTGMICWQNFTWSNSTASAVFGVPQEVTLNNDHAPPVVPEDILIRGGAEKCSLVQPACF